MTPAPFESDESAAVPGREAAVADAVGRWRRELSTVGGPNTLLWYAEQRTGALDLTTAHPGGMSMVLAGRPVRLSDLVRERGAFAEARRRAVEIRDRALELSQQRGVATGFLAVGMATWDHRGSGPAPQAPVLLRSCDLRPTDAGCSDFDVDLGQEVELNPVLEEYLRAAAGIDVEATALAEMSILTTGFDPYPVYAVLARVCAGIPGFTITPRLLVSTFPYSKLRMVSDLAGQEEQLARSDVLASLARSVETAAGEGTPRIPVGAQGGHSDVDPDPDPDSERLVLDADARQSEVVDAVLRGRDLVVVAPPGTGASQTIANIVAGLAGRRRSVLLVAQERSEIEDVTAHLASVGLERLVFDVGDTTFDHRGSVDRLAALLGDRERDQGTEGGEASGVPRSAISASARLRTHRDLLREHLAALHQRRAPWGVTVHEAQCAITELGSHVPAPASRVRIRGAALERLSRARLDELSAELGAAVAAGAWSDADGSDPWYGARITTPDEAERAGEIVARLSGGGLDSAATTLDGILTESSLPPATTVGGWGATLATMSGVRDTLEVFRPEVFDVPLDEHVAATGTREYRRDHDTGLSAANRMRVRRQAARLLRPGRPPADLHAELLRARRQREAWHDLVGAGGRPEISPLLDEAQAAYGALDDDLTWLGERLATTGAGDDLHTIPMPKLRARLGSLAARPERLAVLPRVVPVLDELRAAGMGEVLDDFAARGVTAAEVGPELQHIWWVSVERQVADADPRYGKHDGNLLRQTLVDFADTDREHLDVNADRIRREAASWRTEALGSHRAEATLVRAEAVRAGRSDRPRPMRAVVDSASDLLLACAPCWAMSPLVVAETLPAGPRFDVVVVAGAGRITSAVASSALARARQVVVVGDPEQSGPTAYVTGPGASPGGDGPQVSSVLDDLGSVLPSHRLTWAHGRRDERLLALPNQAAYAGSLVSVPAPDTASPVSLVVVDGRADLEPGEDTTIDSTDVEVERVAELVIAHGRETPGTSLAVVTVTRRHAERVRHALDAAGVQPGADLVVVPMGALGGRSRDRVILSVGYGRTRHGRVLHRFPELGAPAAHQSLTGALTSARESLTVVSSLTADDLDPARLTEAGLALRDVLAAAGVATGTHQAPVDGAARSADPLVADLADRLRREDLVVAENHGIGPRTIDLVVADPHDESRWLVAVEGDGPSEATGLATRDRDRLWAQELRDRGWRHVRVWGTDLYRDPAREVARVMAAVRAVTDPEAQPVRASRRVVRPATGADAPEGGDPVGQTRDDTDAGWGERPSSDSAHDRWLEEQRPPHWD